MNFGTTSKFQLLPGHLPHASSSLSNTPCTFALPTLDLRETLGIKSISKQFKDTFYTPTKNDRPRPNPKMARAQPLPPGADSGPVKAGQGKKMRGVQKPAKTNLDEKNP